MMPTTHRFQGASNNFIAAQLEVPVDADPTAYALFAHGLRTSSNPSAAEDVSRSLASHGIATLRFDLSDDSDASAADVVAAAEFMAEQFGAPSILVGHAKAGTAVLHAAARIPSTRAIATVAAPFRDEDGLGDAIRELKCALLVLHGPRDDSVGIENAARIFEHARHPKSFVSLDQSDHLLSDPSDSAYAGVVIGAWASRYVESSTHRHEADPPADNRIATVTGASGYRTEIMANGHALVSDEPLAVGGTNAGPTPYNLLASALGACTGMTLRMYADRKQWPLERVSVHLTHSKVHAVDCQECEQREGRIDHLRREIELEGPLDDAQRQRLLEIAERCPVHRTLQSDVRIESVLK